MDWYFLFFFFFFLVFFFFFFNWSLFSNFKITSYLLLKLSGGVLHSSSIFGSPTFDIDHPFDDFQNNLFYQYHVSIFPCKSWSRAHACLTFAIKPSTTPCWQLCTLKGDVCSPVSFLSYFYCFVCVQFDIYEWRGVPFLFVAYVSV